MLLISGSRIFPTTPRFYHSCLAHATKQRSREAEIPNPNFQPPRKFQISIIKTDTSLPAGAIGVLELVICLEFGFGIWDFHGLAFAGNVPK
jgi:hypothetical protein